MAFAQLQGRHLDIQTQLTKKLLCAVTANSQTIAKWQNQSCLCMMTAMGCCHRKMGWNKSNAWIAHGCQLTPDDVSAFAKWQVGVAHCPCSNSRLADGICPVSSCHTPVRFCYIPVTLRSAPFMFLLHSRVVPVSSCDIPVSFCYTSVTLQLQSC